MSQCIYTTMKRRLQYFEAIEKFAATHLAEHA